MSDLRLYVAETDHPKGTKANIVVKDEITQEELASVFLHNNTTNFSI